MEFRWDPQKERRNQRKHRVGFREAATVFEDPLSTTFPDIDHSLDDERFLTVGMSAMGRILVIAHTEYEEEIRIISARPATPSPGSPASAGVAVAGVEANANSMKKKARPQSPDDLRPEYHFASMKGGVRGKYAQRARASSNIVLLDPDIAKAFPTDHAVNDALRSLLKKSVLTRR